MSRILLLLALLYPAIALGQSAQNPSSQPNAEPNAQSNENAAPENMTITLSGIDVDNFIQQLQTIATNTAPDTNAENRRDAYQYEAVNLQRSDLAAQNSMATSTFWLFVFGGIGLGISLYGVVLLVNNLRLTNEMVMQSRAWITPSRTKITGAPLIIGANQVIQFEWINTGESPALKTRHRIGTTEVPRITEYEMARAKISEFPMSEWQVAGVIGRDQVFGSTLAVIDEALKSMRDGKTSTLVCIEVVYETVFSNIKRRSEAIYEVTLISGGGFNINPISHNHECT